MQRWYYNTKFITTYIRKTIGVMGYLIAEWTKYRAYKTFWYEGTGRHNQQEVLQLVEEDLKALSDYLGKHTIYYLCQCDLRLLFIDVSIFLVDDARVCMCVCVFRDITYIPLYFGGLSMYRCLYACVYSLSLLPSIIFPFLTPST